MCYNIAKYQISCKYHEGIMKYVISVSKTYKHRGRYINHQPKTKKHWHIYYWEYDEVEEEWKMYIQQVSWFSAMYYKSHKWKKIMLYCPECNIDSLHFIKKRTQKHILKEDCPNCLGNYRDILEEIENS